MTFIKTTGIVTLGTALLVSGGLFLSNSATAQQQKASPATATVTADDSVAVEDWETFETPLQQSEESTNQNDTNTQSIPGIQNNSLQVIRLQQQIEDRMISCAQGAEQAQEEIIRLRSEENSLEAQRDALNDRIRGIDSSSPEGREQRNQLQNERNELQNGREQLRNAISQTRKSFNQSRSACRQEINALRSSQNEARNQLNRDFNDSLRINYTNNR